MVVGEPTLMGGEFGDEDERLITRLENTQYDAANGIDDEDDFNNSPALGNNSPWNTKPPNNQDTKPESTAPQPSHILNSDLRRAIYICRHLLVMVEHHHQFID
ncbi:hypothetical protein JZ751_006054 [Albula glossodonta]|uniref:LIM interaction domain-containing protein n=1 Tax=Albula glossodonta TaxID=121402 RepID=A0A8T2PEF4_9TELE|nr:hypothetical protein JZ751_006054 [Albula glossodonta]